jgi:rRNA-processing protein EBP2
MGKNKKRSKTTSKASPGIEQSASQKMEKSKNEAEKEERVLTMKALQEMSDSDSDGDELLPEEEWDADAKALRDAIEGGIFETLLKKSKEEKEDDDDDESIEEVVLDDDDDDDHAKEDSPKAQKSNNEQQEKDGNDDDESSSSEGEDAQEDEEEADNGKEHGGDESENDDDDGSDDDESEHDDDDDDEAKEKEETTASPFNKGLAVVTQELQAAKRHLPWVETFDIVPKTPLPFEPGTATALDIHDDLKREVAFYDMALEAVQEARAKCDAAKVPFTRPEDFFAEMVKTDGTIFM